MTRGFLPHYVLYGSNKMLVFEQNCLSQVSWSRQGVKRSVGQKNEWSQDEGNLNFGLQVVETKRTFDRRKLPISNAFKRRCSFPESRGSE